MAKRNAFGTETAAQRVARRLDDINHHLEAHDNLAVDLAREVASLRELVAELNVQTIFIMNAFSFTRKVSTIADAAGQFQTVRETLADRYRNGGRDMLITQLEAENAAADQARQTQAAEDAPATEDGGEEDPAKAATRTH
jgi:hypothetical protein